MRLNAPQPTTEPSRQMLLDEVRILRDGLRQAERIRRLYSQNVEQLKAAIKARKQAEAHVTALLQAALNGIIEVNETHTIIFANPAAHQIFGWPADGLLGQSFETLVSPLERDALQLGLTRYFQTGASPLIGPVFEVTGLRHDGARVPCEYTLAAVQGPAPVRSLLAIVQDISVRKREEADALRLAGVETMRQLLEGITHGVKNPLFILTGRLQLLESKLTRTECVDCQIDVEKIQTAVQRLTTALGQLDAFTTTHQLNPVPCSVALIVEEAAAYLADRFTKDRISLITRIAADLPDVVADPNQFRLLFLNLMLHAVERMRPHGRGTLTMTAVHVHDAEPRPILITPPLAATSDIPGPRIEISVQHDGPPIPSEQVSRLFEPFATEPEPRTGTGLELWSVRTIVMALRGAIRYEPHPDRGISAFVIQLPAPTET